MSGSVAAGEAVDVLAVDAVFLGGHLRVCRSSATMSNHLSSPLRTTGAERLLADDVRQQHEVGWPWSPWVKRNAGQRRGVRGIGVAAAGQEGRLDLLQVLDLDRRELHVVGAEVVGDRQFGAGAGLHADRGAVQSPWPTSRRRTSSPGSRCRRRNYVGANRKPEAGLAAERPGGLADQHVHFARLQRGEAVLRGQRRRTSPCSRRRSTAAAMARQPSASMPLHHALAVGQREPGDVGRHAADQLAARLAPHRASASRSLGRAPASRMIQPMQGRQRLPRQPLSANASSRSPLCAADDTCSRAILRCVAKASNRYSPPGQQCDRVGAGSVIVLLMVANI